MWLNPVLAQKTLNPRNQQLTHLVLLWLLHVAHYHFSQLCLPISSIQNMSQLEPWEMEGSVSDGPPQCQTSAQPARSDFHNSTAAIDEPWQSDLELKPDEPPTWNQLNSVSMQNSTRNADVIGSADTDLHSVTSPSYTGESRPRRSRNNNEATDNLSLWDTFKIMYKRRPRIKYYLIGLLILLIAASIILGVSLSSRKKQNLLGVMPT
jgi:hypothetical protein